MKEENKLERLITVLRRHYYGNIITLALLLLLMLFRFIPTFRESELIGVTLERYTIMISIIAIPLALKLFAQKLKKVHRPAETAVALRKYKNASFLRLYIISAVTLLNILLFGFSHNSNFMWITVILFIIFLYCKPSYVELASLTEVPEENRATEEEVIEDSENKTGEEVIEDSENRTDDEEAAGK